jgi:hypothetical protein
MIKESTGIRDYIYSEEELDKYQQDSLVQNYVKEGLKLQRVIIVFWGREMVYCEVT